MSRPFVVAVAVAVLVSVSAGCGAMGTAAPAAEPTTTEPASSSAPATPSASAATPAASPTAKASAAKPKATPAGTPSRPVEVPETLRFTATTVDGKPFDGASLAGQPTLFWFWAPWCPTCRGQIPQVTALAKEYTDQVQVVGVGAQDSASAIRGFAHDAAGPTHLSDEQGTVWKHFAVAEQSSFVLLDAEGNKVFSTGYGGSDALPERVAEVAR